MRFRIVVLPILTPVFPSIFSAIVLLIGLPVLTTIFAAVGLSVFATVLLPVRLAIFAPVLAPIGLPVFPAHIVALHLRRAHASGVAESSTGTRMAAAAPMSVLRPGWCCD